MACEAEVGPPCFEYLYAKASRIDLLKLNCVDHVVLIFSFGGFDSQNNSMRAMIIISTLQMVEPKFRETQ